VESIIQDFCEASTRKSPKAIFSGYEFVLSFTTRKLFASVGYGLTCCALNADIGLSGYLDVVIGISGY
jgi:hypothetical protein